MDKQKQLFKTLLTSIGFTAEDADSTVSLAFPEEGTEPSLDIAAIQLKAQEYATPLVKDSIIAGERGKLRGQYVGEYLGKIAAASGGKITRKMLEDMDVEQALKLYTDTVKAGVTGNESEHLQMIAALNEQLAQKDVEAAQKIEALEKGYNAERTHIANTEGMFKMLGDKKLTVAQDAAAKLIYRELSDKYNVKFNPAINDFDLFDKQDDSKQVKNPANTNFLKGSEEIANIIKTYNLEAVSNGGSGGAGGGKPPITQTQKIPGALPKGKSLLGSSYENEGLYDKAS